MVFGQTDLIQKGAGLALYGFRIDLECDAPPTQPGRHSRHDILRGGQSVGQAVILMNHSDGLQALAGKGRAVEEYVTGIHGGEARDTFQQGGFP